MRLEIVDHLQPMLDGAQLGISRAERCGVVGVDPSVRGQRGQRVAGRGHAQRRIAPAMDQLVNLREELDFADAAAAALQIISGAERLPWA
jgi:hypothetical protein